MPAYLVIVRPSHSPQTEHPLSAQARDDGLAVEAVAEERRYLLAGDLDQVSLHRLATELLVDPVATVAQVVALDDVPQFAGSDESGWAIDVAYRPGVTDNEGDSVRVGAAHAGIAGVTGARTVQRVVLHGALAQADAQAFAYRVLANDLVEAVLVARPGDMHEASAFYHKLLELPTPTPPHIGEVALLDADDAALVEISRRGVLALDLDEMRTIQGYFRRAERNPTDGELETIAQTWSEHCSHKTFKARIAYHAVPSSDNATDHAISAGDYPKLAELEGGEVEIDSLLKTYLVAATDRVRQPWLLSAFVDNAGIVAFGEDDALSMKVETHNHPSALEPFGGANTGVGGVVRDVLGVSSQPIANLDVLCFGPPDEDPASLPASVLHPARIAEGVVAGVRDYGNKLGVPTVAGSVLYDSGYTRNPLVFCGTVGLAPRSAHRQGAASGDAVVVVGGKTGRDGIHGATFSSVELTHDTAEIVGAAVQIGDPITEKQVIDVLTQARDRDLFRAITDCGAGGLSSAVGEMGEQTGVAVELGSVPTKYPGLQPWEIWLSEAQERMVVAVPPVTLDEFLALCNAEDVEATVIGHFTSDRMLLVTFGGEQLVRLDMEFLHNGRPQRTMDAIWSPPALVATQAQSEEARATLLALLAHPNIASKEPIVRTYDHLVQGRTVQGPLHGVHGDAPTDAAVLHPRHDHPEAIAIGCGINPWYGLIDPYWMALAACDEALRNVVAVGGDPARCSLLDNFCWGDPREPDRLAGLVRAAAGCHDAAVAWNIPFISGKDSLNNEYRDVDGQRVPIPPSLLISALAIVPSLAAVTTAELKAAGNHLYLVGTTGDHLGGSHVGLLGGVSGGAVPRVDLRRAKHTFERLHHAIVSGLVLSCHDLSEGGLGVAAAEMTFGDTFGLDLDLRRVPTDSETMDNDVLLWSESPSRFLVEVRVEDAAAFERVLADVPFGRIGSVTDEARLRVAGIAGESLLDMRVEELKAAWKTERGMQNAERRAEDEH
jgi:phosphoribosylformylglycinamidine synthase subunit PurSL